MRHTLMHSIVFGLASALVLSITVNSSADDAFDVAVAKGKVVVTAKGNWHINKKYPWKLTVGEKKISVQDFSLGDQSASVQAPAGTGKLRGGICNEGQCRVIQTSVNIP